MISNRGTRVIHFLYLALDRLWLLFAYILSTYLFYLPWLPYWKESFHEDNGIIVMAATTMVFLSPLIFPLVLGLMGVSILIQLFESHPFLALLAMFSPVIYYAFILTISVFIIRMVAERLRRWLVKQSATIIKTRDEIYSIAD